MSLFDAARLVLSLETSGIVSPGAVWTPLTNGVMTVSTNFVLTNNITASTAFYRLHGQ